MGINSKWDRGTILTSHLSWSWGALISLPLIPPFWVPACSLCHTRWHWLPRISYWVHTGGWLIVTSKVPSILLISEFAAKTLEGRVFYVVVISPNEVSSEQGLPEKYYIQLASCLCRKQRCSHKADVCQTWGSSVTYTCRLQHSELWTTSQSHHRLNFSQPVRWKWDAHFIQRTLEPNTVALCT